MRALVGNPKGVIDLEVPLLLLLGVGAEVEDDAAALPIAATDEKGGGVLAFASGGFSAGGPPPAFGMDGAGRQRGDGDGLSELIDVGEAGWHCLPVLEGPLGGTVVEIGNAAGGSLTLTQIGVLALHGRGLGRVLDVAFRPWRCSPVEEPVFPLCVVPVPLLVEVGRGVERQRRVQGERVE